MKVTFAVLLLFFILPSFSAKAQENEIPVIEVISPNGNVDSNLNEDKPLLFEQESKVIKRDSIQLKGTAPQKSKTDQKSPSSKNEDALSFNFLYYIIQKFKISDLVDN